MRDVGIGEEVYLSVKVFLIGHDCPVAIGGTAIEMLAVGIEVETVIDGGIVGIVRCAEIVSDLVGEGVCRYG